MILLIHLKIVLLSLLWFLPCREIPVVILVLDSPFPFLNLEQKCQERGFVHSFIRHIEALSSSAWTELGSSITCPACRKGEGRRQAYHLSGFRPEVAPGTLVTFLGWEHRHMGTTNGKEGWEMATCVSGCRSLPMEDGEKGLRWTASSLHHPFYLQNVCAPMKVTVTWGREWIFKFII